MDPSLDPRLQPSPNDSNEGSFDQTKTTSYPDVNGQISPTSKQTAAPPLPGATPRQQQQQYYGAPTPSSSYNSETPGSGQTYPYDNGIQSYGVPSGVPYGGPLPTAAEVAADLKRPRACEACRQLKVKCEPDDVVAGTCRRCFRSGRQCVITMPSRKRQKKTDSRVAELEKKIDRLTQSLQSQQSPGQSQPEGDADVTPEHLGVSRAHTYPESNLGQWIPPKPPREHTGSKDFSLTPAAGTGLKRKLSNELPSNLDGEDSPFPPPPKNLTSGNFSTAQCPMFPNSSTSVKDLEAKEYVDVIDRQILDADTAYQCFDRYVHEMAPVLPFVVFPQGTKGEDVRRTKPILFLAILSAACNTIRPDIYPILVNEIMRTYADRVVVRGQKTMELVQALLISTTWYAPPDRYEELNFNQLIHMAAVLAIDLGMGKRMKTPNIGMSKEYAQKKPFSTSPNPEAPETRRTWLGCYFMCANASMSLRRPLLIRWTGYMDDSLQLLESSPEALDSDKWLVSLVRGQHIAEEVGFQFSMDDPTVEVSITEPKTQYHLKAFERQLTEWRNRTPKELQNALFSHASNITSLYVHEISMHHHHNIDDFKPPYSVQPEATTPEPDVITPAHIESLTICIQSIHGTFDAVLSMDITTLRSLPTLTYVRTSYAAVALIKLTSAINGSNRRFGEVFTDKDLKAEYYLDALIKKFRAAGDGERSRVAIKFSFIFSMLRTWLHKIIEADTKAANGPDGKSNFGSANGAVGQNPIQQNPKSLQWANTAGSENMGNNGGQSGLHMLSELASSSNTPTQNASASNAASIAAAAGSWPQQYPVQSIFTGDFSNGTVSGVDMDTMGFDMEDWDALSYVVNDPVWLNIPLEQQQQPTWSTM